MTRAATGEIARAFGSRASRARRARRHRGLSRSQGPRRDVPRAPISSSRMASSSCATVRSCARSPARHFTSRRLTIRRSIAGSIAITRASTACHGACSWFRKRRAVSSAHSSACHAPLERQRGRRSRTASPKLSTCGPPPDHYRRQPQMGAPGRADHDRLCHFRHRLRLRGRHRPRTQRGAETPDGRPGVRVLLFAVSTSRVAKAGADPRRPMRAHLRRQRLLRRESQARRSSSWARHFAISATVGKFRRNSAAVTIGAFRSWTASSSARRPSG